MYVYNGNIRANIVGSVVFPSYAVKIGKRFVRAYETATVMKMRVHWRWNDND